MVLSSFSLALSLSVPLAFAACCKYKYAHICLAPGKHRLTYARARAKVIIRFDDAMNSLYTTGGTIFYWILGFPVRVVPVGPGAIDRTRLCGVCVYSAP